MTELTEQPRNMTIRSNTEGGNDLRPPPPITVIEFSDMKPEKIECHDAPTVDVLLLTANKKELRAAYEILSQPKVADFGENLSIVYFGKIGKNNVALIKSQVGAGGTGGAQATCTEATSKLKPKAVIAVGVCFGMKKEKQKLADVLVSNKLATYAQIRVNADSSENPRGSIPQCNPRLVQLFCNVGCKCPCEDANKANVYSGLIISGPELIDNKDRLEKLRERYQEALGGEMEGEGIYVACENSKVPWIICKSISDWADGTKNEEWQLYAAAVAASFVKHVLTQNDFTVNTTSTDRPDGNEHHVSSQQETNAATKPSGDEADGNKVPEETGTAATKQSGDEADDNKVREETDILTERPSKLNASVYNNVCQKLNQEIGGKDWKTLAGVMGYNNEFVKNLKRSDDPAEALLSFWETKSGHDVKKLIGLLKEIERNDIIELIQQ